MKTVAIVQARASSTRLPGKVLLPFGSLSVLGSVVRRLERARSLHEVVVATSDDPSDDAVAEAASELGVPVVRGSLDDVLDRFLTAARARNADVIVRITADCPLVDPAIVDGVVAEFFSSGDDYVSNAQIRTFPRGLDVEVFSRQALETAAFRATEAYEREHVTPYLYQHPAEFRIGRYVDASGVDRSAWRWTLDTEDDYRFLCALVAQTSRDVAEVMTPELVEIIERQPTLLALNASVRQKTLEE